MRDKLLQALLTVRPTFTGFIIIDTACYWFGGGTLHYWDSLEKLAQLEKEDGIK